MYRGAIGPKVRRTTIHSGADAPIVSNDATETPEGGRIDLSQFKGHTPGPWDYEYGPTVSGHEDDADVLTIKTPPTFDEDKAWVNQRLAAAGPDLIAELKRMYAREDMLLDALRIIRDDLDDALKVYPSLQMKEVVAKVRNFANDASQ